MLSISKLCEVAQVQDIAALQNEATQRSLEAVDDRLQVVETHERLIEQFKRKVGPQAAHSSANTLAKKASQAAAPELDDRPALRLVSRLMKLLLD